MIGVGDMRKGVTVEIDGTLYRVLDYGHHKTGRGSAQIRLKLKDVKGGHTIDRTFQASERFTRARIEKRPMQYLYESEDLYTFMDSESYDQVALSRGQLEDALPYLTENLQCEVISYDEGPIGVELPTAVELAVANTEPGFKGDTAQGGTKAAEMETGLVVQVPLFIETGEKLKIDTRTGQYLTRV
ncbi:MAG: elongation factor P [Dehalococcoidia bacterium]|nr:elongation factor P [Dehalococcoidia bacterium]